MIQTFKDRGIIAVISGFSGAGKGTIMKQLVSRYDRYRLSVSMTTREPRPGEVDGKEYFFVEEEAFLKLVEEDGLIEHANYVGHFYGTPKKFVEEQLEAGKDVLLEIETQGALQIKKKFPESLLLFVTPPSVEELERRLRGRGTETEEVIQSRIHRAQEEAKGMLSYDYILVNDQVDACVVQMHEVIQAAKCEGWRRKDLADQILRELEEK